MVNSSGTVFVVDDDPDVCEALRWLFESVDLPVETYENATHYLEHYDANRRGCLVLDVRLPLTSGLELLEQLKTKKKSLPVVVITGHGDIPMVIRAMKAGAVDFFTKPINNQSLLELVQKHVQDSCSSISCVADDVYDRISQLTKRERQVMELVVEGRLNKQVAHELNISISTVEAHRARVMQKMQVKTVAQLIKIYLESKH